MYICNVHTVGIYTNVLLACMYVHTHVFTLLTYMCKCTTCLFVHAFICMYYVVQWNVDYPNVNHPNRQLSEQAMTLLTQQFFLFFFFFFFLFFFLFKCLYILIINETTHWSMLRNK